MQDLLETNRQIRKELGSKIKIYMVDFDKTQDEFAKISGLSRVYVNNLINNKNADKIIRIATIEKLNSILKRDDEQRTSEGMAQGTPGEDQRV